ncbi:hypothetical protein N9C59_00445 [Flavobacteriales bacterium]|nr:hypothetical protein [Flavobacteriales bacterium]
MKKFITQILFFLIAFFLFEKAYYVFLYFSPKLEKDKRLEYVLNGNMNKDLIILGSSRGARNIIASQIEESLNVSCYNLSYPGSNIEFHEFILRALIKYNRSPKTLLLAVDDPHELLHHEPLQFRLDRLYPLAKYKYINDEMISRKEKNFLSKFLILGRINISNFNLKQKKYSMFDTLKICGSMPISFQKNDFEFNNDKSHIDYEIKNELPKKRLAFKKIQDMCKLKNIELFIVYSPNLKGHNRFFIYRIKELSNQSILHIKNDTSNISYKNKKYYHDGAHLNTTGAKIFTNDIIKKLKENKNFY